MTHAEQPRAFADALPDVLDNGGDEQRQRDLERLRAVVVGVAAGILTYVAVAQGPWAAHARVQPPPAPVASPAGPTAMSTPLGPTPGASPGSTLAARPGHLVAPRCPVRVRAVPGGPSVCFGSADAATDWLASRRAAHRGSAWGGRS